ncbi:MAG TPA: hypothetical protein VGR27_14490 [Longimicrobiaceae bacterium]|nr:hypothetical protein [Longimicrobiaceae bacterium]
MKERRLVATRRLVSPERRAEYDAAWVRLHTAATARGAHAWRFAAADRGDVYVEFLEFAAEHDPREDFEAGAALRTLEATFPGPPPPAAATEELRSIGEE